MTGDDRVALRGGVALCVHDPAGVVRVDGDGAWEALDRVLPCSLALRDGQGRHTLLVGEDGRAEADVVVIAEHDGFWLLVDGMPVEQVADRIRGAGGRASDPGLARIELGGPFAWELAAKIAGAGVVGLPYLELRVSDQPPLRCLRAGRTGEYGYELLVPQADAASLRQRLLELGAALDVREVPRSAFDEAALENAFWVPGHPGLAGLDPLELQLQWRLAWDKDFPGSAALRARRERGIPRRLTGFRADAATAGAPIRLGAAAVGEIRVVLPGTPAGAIGYALVDTALAHPGVPGLESDGVPISLVSPPFVANLSLFVKPQRHRYANRAEIVRP